MKEKRIILKLNKRDARILKGFVSGAIGTSDSGEFNKFGKRILKQLDGLEPISQLKEGL